MGETEKLMAAYPPEQKSFILPVKRCEAADFASSLARDIETMDDFDRFPEGAAGAVIHALVRRLAATSPDAGDFGYAVQGLETILKTSVRVLRASFARAAD